jgi:hypothetical protein
MTKIGWLLVIVLLLSAPTVSVADDTISFKGIKFGMNANQIAELGGGNTENGCATAINDASSLKGEDNKPWTYGGIDSWRASCVEGNDESNRVPGFSGMYKLQALVHSHNDGLAKSVGRQTYSVVELANNFSKVFGKFKVETKIIKNGMGQQFVKKRAIATKKGTFIEIMDALKGSDHQDFIHIRITSLDYLAKENKWEKQKNKKKADDAKADL